MRVERKVYSFQHAVSHPFWTQAQRSQVSIPVVGLPGGMTYWTAHTGMGQLRARSLWGGGLVFCQVPWLCWCQGLLWLYGFLFVLSALNTAFQGEMKSCRDGTNLDLTNWKMICFWKRGRKVSADNRRGQSASVNMVSLLVPNRIIELCISVLLYTFVPYCTSNWSRVLFSQF